MNKLLPPLAFLAMLSCLSALGCSNDSHDSPVGTGGQNALPEALKIRGDRRIPFTPTSDLEFADFFIMHDEMVINMATAERDRGSDPDVVELAKTISKTQAAEVETLFTLRGELGGDGPPMLSDPYIEAKMQAIGAASGTELDQMFLLEMIPQYAAALAPARRAMGYLQAAELKRMAPQILQSNAEQIGEMQAMLKRLGVVEAGEDLAPDSVDRPDFGLVGDRRVPLTPEDDLQFTDFFIPHHRMALELVDQELARGSASDVVAMAKKMKQTQSDEEQLMQSKRRELTGDAEPPAATTDPLAESDMERMTSLSGDEQDQLFLQLMIVQHGAALPTSHRAKPHVTDADLGRLADDMFQALAVEIGDMQKLLTH